MGVETRTTSKTGGQKGVKIERHDLIPIGPLRELAVHFGRGARKYDNHQWRAGYEWSNSYSALERHLKLFWQGLDYDICSNEPDNCKHTDADGNPFEAVDPDTCYNHLGSHHMVAVAWHSFVLLEFKDRFPEFDDRYKPKPTKADIDVAVEAFNLDPALKDFDLPDHRGDATWWLDHVLPEQLSWISKHTGKKEPVCICTEGERADQGDIARHYLIMHGIKL